LIIENPMPDLLLAAKFQKVLPDWCRGDVDLSAIAAFPDN